MNMEERRGKIVDLVNDQGTVSLAQLKSIYPGISDVTLRSDLKELDRTKQLVRVHGGARSLRFVVGSDGLQPLERNKNSTAKNIVAHKAIDLIRPNTTVFFDSGTTVEALVRELPPINIQAFVCNVPAMIELSKKPSIQTFVIGGRLSTFTLSINGSQTLQDLQSLTFDQVFLGTTSYEQGSGFSCGSDEEAALKHQCVHCAGQTIALIDSSKIGHRSTFPICRLDEVDIVVGDDSLPEDFKRECEAAGVEVL